MLITRQNCNIFSITLKYIHSLIYFSIIIISVCCHSISLSKHVELWHPNMTALYHSPFIYREPWDVINDVTGCGIYSETDYDACFEEIQQRLAGRLIRVDSEVLGRATQSATGTGGQDALLLSQKQAVSSYFALRNSNCDRLSHAAAGATMHTLRRVYACQFWMDLHRRSLLQETAGEAPMRIKPGHGGPHGPYRLTDIWRLAGAGAGRLSKLKSQEAASLRRLASARRRVRRVLDDWEEWQDFVDIADRDFRQSGPAFVRYRHAQCDDYTPKLAAALGPTPTPEEAATACRVLVNIEQATLLRYDFAHQPLMSQDRKPGESRNRR